MLSMPANADLNLGSANLASTSNCLTLRCKCAVSASVFPVCDRSCSALRRRSREWPSRSSRAASYAGLTPAAIGRVHDAVEVDAERLGMAQEREAVRASEIV